MKTLCSSGKHDVNTNLSPLDVEMNLHTYEDETKKNDPPQNVNELSPLDEKMNLQSLHKYGGETKKDNPEQNFEELSPLDAEVEDLTTPRPRTTREEKEEIDLTLSADEPVIDLTCSTDNIYNKQVKEGLTRVTDTESGTSDDAVAIDINAKSSLSEMVNVVDTSAIDTSSTLTLSSKCTENVTSTSTMAKDSQHVEHPETLMSTQSSPSTQNEASERMPMSSEIAEIELQNKTTAVEDQSKQQGTTATIVRVSPLLEEKSVITKVVRVSPTPLLEEKAVITKVVRVSPLPKDKSQEMKCTMKPATMAGKTSFLPKKKMMVQKFQLKNNQSMKVLKPLAKSSYSNRALMPKMRMALNMPYGQHKTVTIPAELVPGYTPQVPQSTGYTPPVQRSTPPLQSNQTLVRLPPHRPLKTDFSCTVDLNDLATTLLEAVQHKLKDSVTYHGEDCLKTIDLNITTNQMKPVNSVNKGQAIYTPDGCLIGHKMVLSDSQTLKNTKIMHSVTSGVNSVVSTSVTVQAVYSSVTTTQQASTSTVTTSVVTQTTSTAAESSAQEVGSTCLEDTESGVVSRSTGLKRAESVATGSESTKVLNSETSQGKQKEYPTLLGVLGSKNLNNLQDSVEDCSTTSVNVEVKDDSMASVVEAGDESMKSVVEAGDESMKSVVEASDDSMTSVVEAGDESMTSVDKNDVADPEFHEMISKDDEIEDPEFLEMKEGEAEKDEKTDNKICAETWELCNNSKEVSTLVSSSEYFEDDTSDNVAEELSKIMEESSCTDDACLQAPDNGDDTDIQTDQEFKDCDEPSKISHDIVEEKNAKITEINDEIHEEKGAVLDPWLGLQGERDDYFLDPNDGQLKLKNDASDFDSSYEHSKEEEVDFETMDKKAEILKGLGLLSSPLAKKMELDQELASQSKSSSVKKYPLRCRKSNSKFKDFEVTVATGGGHSAEDIPVHEALAQKIKAESLAKSSPGMMFIPLIINGFHIIC